MVRARNKLNARTVETLKEPGRYSDGGSLYLLVGEGRARWIYQFAIGGRRREMGLGGYPQVSLRDARKARDDAERQLQIGQDPIESRSASKTQVESTIPTFGEMVDEVATNKSSEWRSVKHAEQWKASLTVHAAPLLKRPVNEITTIDVLTVLKPLWASKQVTASRVRGRIETVLDAAKALKYREGENPAAWRGNLSHLLAGRQRLARKNFAALPYERVPEFVSRLRELSGVYPLALEFTILTAVRTNEALGAVWDEINLKDKIWIIPAKRTKKGREHRVPLSKRCIEILASIREAKLGNHVFPSSVSDRPMDGTTLIRLCRKLDPTATVHGFRSSFRDWSGNETNYARELLEAALSHQLGDVSERAYRRSDALEKRRSLMEDWGSFCAQAPVENVVKFKRQLI